MSFLWDQFIDYQLEIISSLAAILITSGTIFLFHPAILVYYHEAVDHSTTVLAGSTKEENSEEVLLSLVIPAYNEEDRLTVMLDECYEYLCKEDCPSLETLKKAYQNANKANKNPTTLVEWIVINDGSADKTSQVFENYVKKLKDSKHPFLWKLVILPVNEGKGAAVQVGMTEATGYYRLMVDADGATTFDKGLEAVSQEMLTATKDTSKQTIVFGSRAGDGAKRSPLRQFLMHSFLRLRSFVVGTPVSIRDTQCGFKLFDRPSAMRLFTNLHLRRWAFDIELVYVALSMKMGIKEVTVPWHEVDGSKLNTGFFALVKVSIGMLRDMCCVRACYVLGIWKIR